jgi:nitrate/TMAO reductase-like tetraheme cytochrome c subunit
MTEEEKKAQDKRKLRRKAETLWRLVTTTGGVADLAEPMKRVEHHFERLTQRQRITIAVIASQFAKACHEIDAEEETRQEAQEKAAESDTPEPIPTE